MVHLDRIKRMVDPICHLHLHCPRSGENPFPCRAILSILSKLFRITEFHRMTRFAAIDLGFRLHLFILHQP